MRQDSESTNQPAIIARTAKEVAARAIAELEAAGALQRTEGHITRIDAELKTYVAEQYEAYPFAGHWIVATAA